MFFDFFVPREDEDRDVKVSPGASSFEDGGEDWRTFSVSFV